MGAFELIRSYGPTPLAELTARLDEEPNEVAEELNRLAGEDLLRIKDQSGNIVNGITPDQAASEESWVAELSPKSIRQSLAR